VPRFQRSNAAAFQASRVAPQWRYTGASAVPLI
jgi:hypothetical protein